MKQIFHNISKWECVSFGMFNNNLNISKEDGEESYRKFLSNLDEFEDGINKVFFEWPISCEQFLSNESINRIAFIGQSAACIKLNVPCMFRGGYKLLNINQQILADTLAFRYLNKWILNNGGRSLLKKIDKYIGLWREKGYLNDIPDEVPTEVMNRNLAPSYKAICIAILKNDHSLKTLGFDGNHSKFYDILKKIELEDKGKIIKKYDKQISFNF